MSYIFFVQQKIIAEGQGRSMDIKASCACAYAQENHAAVNSALKHIAHAAVKVAEMGVIFPSGVFITVYFGRKRGIHQPQAQCVQGRDIFINGKAGIGIAEINMKEILCIPAEIVGRDQHIVAPAHKMTKVLQLLVAGIEFFCNDQQALMRRIIPKHVIFPIAGRFFVDGDTGMRE